MKDYKGKISASIMCADLLNLASQIKELEEAGINMLHIDIMDASFVPNLTFGSDIVNAIKKITELPLDIHLLMDKPLRILRSMAFDRHDIVTIHAECKESVLENAAFVKQRGARFGIALNPDTPIEDVRKYLPYVDVVLLMLIVPGFAGSTMIHGIMEKVGATRKYLDEHKFDNIEIAVDGSVSAERAEYMKSLGASIFVGGTAGIFKKDKSLDETVKNFHSHIGNQI